MLTGCGAAHRIQLAGGLRRLSETALMTRRRYAIVRRPRVAVTWRVPYRACWAAHRLTKGRATGLPDRDFTRFRNDADAVDDLDYACDAAAAVAGELLVVVGADSSAKQYDSAFDLDADLAQSGPVSARQEVEDAALEIARSRSLI